MKRWIVIGLVLLVAIGLGYLAVPRQEKASEILRPSSDSELIPITIGYSRLRISLPVFVGKEKGIFERHGLDASLLMYDTAQPLMQALVESRVEVAGYTALPITFNGMLRSGNDLLFVTTMIEDENHRISYLLRPATQVGEEPVINSVEDLKGKSIGILPTVAYKAWLEAILVKNGLDPDRDVQIRPVAPAQQALSLQSGGVQALFTNDPAATSAIQAGIAELVTPDVVQVSANIVSPFPFGSFNVQAEWARKNPEHYARVVKALNESVDFVNANPEEAKETMRPYLPEAFRDDVEHYPDARYLRTDESSPDDFQNMADLYHQMGIISSKLEVVSLVETGRF